MTIWGGIINSWLSSGLKYNYANDDWDQMPISLTWKSAYQTIVDTGSALIFWGGTENTKGVNNDGYILRMF
jgi:hypothetical protein